MPQEASKFNLTSSGSQLQSKINVSQSIQYQLTLTLMGSKAQGEASSMISLSTYLQSDDSNFYWKDNKNKFPYESEQCGQKIEKQKNFQEVQCGQKFFYKQSNASQENIKEQQSQSMLLVDSEIRQLKQSVQLNCQFDQNNEKFKQNSNQSENMINEQYLSRIQQKYGQSHEICTKDSTQLLKLLAFSKSKENSIIDSIKTKSFQTIENDKIQWLKKIPEIFEQNKNIIEKKNLIIPFSHRQIKLCNQCKIYQQKIKQIQLIIKNKQKQIKNKQKQIKNYENLINQFNQTIFNLKIQNKKLLYQNNQYNYQIQKLLKYKNSKKSYQLTINKYYEDLSIDQIDSKIISPHLSRKTMNNLNLGDKNQFKNYLQNQESRSLHNHKIQPHSTRQTLKYIKTNNWRENSNHSDQQTPASISQAREPTLTNFEDKKNFKTLQEYNSNSKEKKRQSSHKDDKTSIRFSQIAKHTGQTLQVNTDKQNESDNQNILKISPLRIGNFLKKRTRTNQEFNKNLQNHQLNKVSLEDLLSEQSEAKTNKTYKMKSVNPSDFIEQNDYKIDNFKKLLRQRNKCKPQDLDQNSIICKTFKEIGTVKSSSPSKKNIKNQIQCFSPIPCATKYREYSGLGSQIRLQIDKFQKEKDTSTRKYYSPLPQTRAGCPAKITKSRSPYSNKGFKILKQNILQR